MVASFSSPSLDSCYARWDWGFRIVSLLPELVEGPKRQSSREISCDECAMVLVRGRIFLSNLRRSCIFLESLKQPTTLATSAPVHGAGATKEMTTELSVTA
jgi:hypothetical protein